MAGNKQLYITKSIRADKMFYLRCILNVKQPVCAGIFDPFCEETTLPEAEALGP